MRLKGVSQAFHAYVHTYNAISPNPRRLLNGWGELLCFHRIAANLFCAGALAAWFLAAVPVCAQQTQLSSYAGFEGQPVSNIEIAVRPEVEVGKIRPLIRQLAGQPFSTSAMSESVAALQQTHLFSEVHIDLEPQEDGLRIRFILEPADYIGVVQFEGLGTEFAYTALLQAVNISEQSPYVPNMETDGQRGLLDYLHTRGFFAAEATPEIRRDEAHRIVNIVYRCTLHRQARIRDIEFSGLNPRQEAQVRGALRSLVAKIKRLTVKPNQKYDELHIAKAIPLIRDRLRQGARLPPTVRLAAPRYDRDSNRVDVTFDVTPAPNASVQVVGAKISKKTLMRLVPIYQEGTVDQDLVDEGAANLKSYFQTRGFFNVTANSRIEKQGDAVNVIYDIDQGSKHRVASVQFEGNRFFTDSQLKERVQIKKGFLFRHGDFSAQLLRSSETSLAQLYKDAGFPGVSVQAKVRDFNPQLEVTFQIQEGAQDHVASLRLVDNTTQSEAALNAKYPLHLQPGQSYSPKKLETDRNQIVAAYLDLGYPNATVRSAATPLPDDPHKINVTFTIDEGPQVRISDVVLLGEQHARPPFIEGITRKRIKAGDPLSEKNVLQAESDLYDLGVFDWASIKSLQPVTDQTREQMLIKVHESPLNSIDIGGGVEVIPRDGSLPVNSVVIPGLPPISVGSNFTVSQKSYWGPRFTFDFSRHDLFGIAQTATIGTVLSRLDQRAFFTYADPHFHGSSWSALLSASVERTTENPVYTAELGLASFQIDRTLDPKRTKHLIGRYTFDRTILSNILIPNLVLPQDQSVRLSTFTAEYVHDTRDKPLDAHRGIYQTFDFGVTSTAYGASANFVRFLGQTAFYRSVKPWLVLADNFRLGFAAKYANSLVPLSERFFSGGPDSLRGFPIDGAGPQRPVQVCSNPANPATCTLISVPVGGNMLFIVNSEARFPLPVKHIGGVIFYDGGNVYSAINIRQFADNFTHTVGVGLRYDTPVGPVRFDFGYRITPVPGVRATQYFVTLGQSF